MSEGNRKPGRPRGSHGGGRRRSAYRGKHAEADVRPGPWQEPCRGFTWEDMPAHQDDFKKLLFFWFRRGMIPPDLADRKVKARFKAILRRSFSAGAAILLACATTLQPACTTAARPQVTPCLHPGLVDEYSHVRHLLQFPDLAAQRF